MKIIKDKYLDLARELWSISEMVITIVIGALVMVPKGLEERLEELEIRKRIANTQTTSLLRLA